MFQKRFLFFSSLLTIFRFHSRFILLSLYADTVFVVSLAVFVCSVYFLLSKASHFHIMAHYINIIVLALSLSFSFHLVFSLCGLATQALLFFVCFERVYSTSLSSYLFSLSLHKTTCFALSFSFPLVFLVLFLAHVPHSLSLSSRSFSIVFLFLFSPHVVPFLFQAFRSLSSSLRRLKKSFFFQCFTVVCLALLFVSLSSSFFLFVYFDSFVSQIHFASFHSFVARLLLLPFKSINIPAKHSGFSKTNKSQF